ncbi:unnamed protein product [Periconia digitata]|uniref:F-box domain-containing protein n=1 Tax=Periconia digitata TaxID=1303443 RepID=A0A9W4ULU7_9PLEO|nr:unnamed protein product [Periconia digitata]
MQFLTRLVVSTNIRQPLQPKCQARVVHILMIGLRHRAALYFFIFLLITTKQAMGYTEIHCRLCAVTFNISRRRLRTEPEWMSWTCTGDKKTSGCQLGKLPNPATCTDEGKDDSGDDCDDYSRKDVTQDSTDLDAIMDEREDEDYTFEEEDQYEELEYQTDCGSDISEEESAMDIDNEPEDQLYMMFRYFINNEPRPKHKCDRGRGYDGKSITAIEMRGCNTAQCLLSKAHHDSAMREEADDQDFERGGRYCLSGLCDHVRSRDSGSEEVVPSRHGVSRPYVDNVSIQADGDNFTAIPFHPACFDIFSRLSRKRFGYINFEALGNWCFDQHDWDSVESNDKNVKKCSDQWWNHRDGCEYLAANPLFIPDLAPILRGVVQDDENFSPQNGSFNVPPNYHDGDGDDVFNTLPLEIRLQTLSYLSSSDIANLRLVSHTFRQLPIFLWRDLLKAEIPWLWEVWSDDVPFIWATTTNEAIVEHRKIEEETRVWRDNARTIIKQEMPEIYDEWDQDVAKLLSERPGFLEAGRADAMNEMVRLPIGKTNWFQLYTEITRNWKSLKGLQNRKRIWIDVEKIVDELIEYS